MTNCKNCNKNINDKWKSKTGNCSTCTISEAKKAHIFSEIILNQENKITLNKSNPRG